VIAPSAFLLFLGVSKKISGLAHHSLFLDSDWNNHFDSIFTHPQWPEHPSYYVCAPSKTDPSVAPAGSENLFILVPVAAGLEDSDVVREEYYERILTDLERRLGEDVRPFIVSKRIFAQRDFRERYNAYKGTSLGLSHTLWQTALFRPQHQSKKVSNLFYTGQYTHPGIGIPMTIISSEVVTRLIRELYD
jgi:phytoene desaturase